ncbi:hypothetical protein [Longispora fulva]|uniref:Transcriptional regulator with XRE-family HTH domain n=1 Tax=Longispora fulva TaxID=619741 RepID=A0A8J7GHZ0_9ACTN|nr:hypothetical protein [Longispora fulva]MBG6137860.1 transcriptional regulator with XRE-family HTH domain [Longispora fulva]
MPPFDPIRIPESAWRREETRRLLRARDVGGLLRFAQQFGGVSQHQLSNATGLLQGRISEIIGGTRKVTALEVYERIADGLNMPNEARLLLGLAPRGNGTILAAIEVPQVFDNQAAAAEEIQLRTQTAASIDVLAVRGLGLLAFNGSLLRSAFNRAATMRVLLLDPECPAATRRAEEVGESGEAFTSGIRHSLARLREFAHQPGLSVQVHLYDTLPIWRMIRLDDTLYLSSFDTRWEGHESVLYRVSATPRGALHAAFSRMFEEMTRRCARVL